jgi:hypothetical protein
VPQNITTQQQFQAFVQLIYPGLTSSNMDDIMGIYSIPKGFNTKGPRVETNGITPPYATEVSGSAIGWQQAANNLYAETTFVCPAYWLADAYTLTVNPLAGVLKHAWRYQYSVPNAFHSRDLDPMMADPRSAPDDQDEGFRRAFQAVWGLFVSKGAPTLDNDESPFLTKRTGKGGHSNGSHGGGGPGGGGGVAQDNVTAAQEGIWTRWGDAGTFPTGGGDGFHMLNMNVTDSRHGPAVADWTIVDGNAWENGRANRCALWARLGSVIQA